MTDEKQTTERGTFARRVSDHEARLAVLEQEVYALRVVLAELVNDRASHGELNEGQKVLIRKHLGASTRLPRPVTGGPR